MNRKVEYLSKYLIEKDYRALSRIDKEHAMSALKFSAEHARVSVLFHTKSDATTLR